MNNINPQNSEVLLKIVSKKLNISPDVLKKQLEEGKFDAAIKGMKPDEAQKFQQAIKNPKLAEQIMSTPQAQELYKKLTGGK